MKVMKINLLSDTVRAYNILKDSLSTVTYSYVDERLYQVMDTLRDIIKEQQEMREELVEEILSRHEEGQ